MIERWPRFVWCAHQSRDGIAKASIWYQRRTTGTGKLQDKFTLAEHELAVSEYNLPFENLIAKFPPPEGWKCEGQK